jgi:hypothetical protein
MRLVACLVVLCVACGAPAAAPARTTGAETAPPPREPAHVRVVHAAPDPSTATVTLLRGDATFAADLAFGASTSYVDVAPGAHALVVEGLRSIESGDAPVLLTAATPQLAPGARVTLVLAGIPGGEPALALSASDDAPPAPAADAAAIRFFHAIVADAALDVCLAGATPHDAATPVFTAVARGSFASAESGAYATLPATGETALQIRAAGDAPCSGRALGIARFSPAAGGVHLLVATGRGGRGRGADRTLLVCDDTPADPACLTVPFTHR